MGIWGTRPVFLGLADRDTGPAHFGVVYFFFLRLFTSLKYTSYHPAYLPSR